MYIYNLFGFCYWKGEGYNIYISYIYICICIHILHIHIYICQLPKSIYCPCLKYVSYMSQAMW